MAGTANSVIGVIGLGQMGGAIAQRLLATGHRLIVHDVDGDRAAGLVETGATAAASAAEVGARAETVIACLPTPAISQAVAGTMPAGGAVSTYIEMSTIGPEAARAIAADLATRGIAMLDLPVSGGPKAAASGALTFIASGPDAVLARVQSIVADVGTVFPVGDTPGMAQLAKLANNALSLVGMALAAEAMVMGVRAGLDAGGLLAAINASTGRNSATADKFPAAVLTRRFDYGGPIHAAGKDLTLFLAEAERLGIATPITAQGAAVWQAAASEGDPQRDFTTIVQPLERAAGVEIRGRAAPAEPETMHVQ